MLTLERRNPVGNIGARFVFVVRVPDGIGTWEVSFLHSRKLILPSLHVNGWQFVQRLDLNGKEDIGFNVPVLWVEDGESSATDAHVILHQGA